MDNQSQDNDFSEALLDSSRRFACSALQAFLEGDYEVFLLHGATGLEHLAKSRLARVHPSLIAGGDFDSALHACGLAALARKPRSRMRTISLKDALKRCGQLNSSVDQLEGQLEL